MFTPDEIKKWVAAIPVSKDEIVKIDLMLRGATDVHDGEKALLTLALAAGARYHWDLKLIDDGGEPLYLARGLLIAVQNVTRATT